MRHLNGRFVFILFPWFLLRCHVLLGVWLNPKLATIIGDQGDEQRIILIEWLPLSVGIRELKKWL